MDKEEAAKLRWAGGGAQRPVMRFNLPKKKGERERVVHNPNIFRITGQAKFLFGSGRKKLTIGSGNSRKTAKLFLMPFAYTFSTLFILWFE